MRIKSNVCLVITGWVVAIVFLLVAPVWAQDQPADNMELLRDKLKADKKLALSEGMALTKAEAKGFWPVYDDYYKELEKLNDRTRNLIKTFSDNYLTMSDDMAKKLVAESIQIDRDKLKLIESYLPKFRKVLSEERKVARFYQIENKIEAILAYELARRIPLMK